ncbi:MAG TPA: N-acetylglucosaminyltransferase [Actinomycetes bacterium]|nr:N-acetylglucosaminyltransferase [Actinomycetes bacterium]
MTTVAYHLETHRSPRQVERLVTTLLRWAPDAIVVISHDERSEPLDLQLLNKLGAVVHHAQGGYSDMSHARRWLSTVDWLYDEGISFDWVSNLSGQDYPVRPLDLVHAELASSTADAYLETFDVFDPSQTPWGVARGKTRYTFHHRRLRRLSQRQMSMLRPVQALNRMQPWFRLTTATGLTVGRRAPAPWGSSMKLYGGSFFTTLRQSAVDHVRTFVKSEPEVIDFLGGALAPAEVFFQTALGWRGENLTVVNDCRRYFDFSQTRFNHPRTLTRSDLSAVYDSGKDFARKFDLGLDAGILDVIDRHLEQVSAEAVG